MGGGVLAKVRGQDLPDGPKIWIEIDGRISDPVTKEWQIKKKRMAGVEEKNGRC